jgi:putative tricarboxylic transport membrane protein
VLSVVGGAIALIILLSPAASTGPKEGEIDYRRLGQYKLGQAATLLGLMIAYALLLNPVGFILATILFLAVAGYVLGERKLHFLVPVAATAAISIWWLVQEGLGIFLRPLPAFL